MPRMMIEVLIYGNIIFTNKFTVKGSYVQYTKVFVDKQNIN